MKTKLLILSLAHVLSACAVAETVSCQFIGLRKVCSNGYSESQIGNSIVGNDGSRRTEIGNTIVYTPPSRAYIDPYAAQLPQMIQYGKQPAQGDAFSGFAKGLED
jgi:hypothetical protein